MNIDIRNGNYSLREFIHTSVKVGGKIGDIGGHAVPLSIINKRPVVALNTNYKLQPKSQAEKVGGAMLHSIKMPTTKYNNLRFEL